MGVASKKLGIQPIWGSKKRNHRCFFWGDVVHGHAMYTVTNHMILFYVANNMVPCFLRSASIIGRPPGRCHDELFGDHLKGFAP